jgi:hypothetical protein
LSREQAELGVIAFAQCVKLDNRERISYLIQMLTLICEHGILSKDGKLRGPVGAIVSSLPQKYFVPIVDHMIARLPARSSNRQTPVHKFIIDFIRRLILEFPHDVIFPCYYAQTSEGIAGDIKSDVQLLIDQLASADDSQSRFVSQTFLNVDRIATGFAAVALTLVQFCYSALQQIRETYKIETLDGTGQVPLRFDVEVLPVLTERLKQPVCESDQEFRSSSLFTRFDNFRKKIADEQGIRRENHIPDRSECIDLLSKFEELVKRETRLQLSRISPDLSRWSFDNFPVFGLSPSVFIHKIEEDILVISSLQRPRKIGVRGCDGHLYHYLLKAHDDLQADHRIMQFFRLMSRFVNTPIPTFAIVPFTSALGIVQWVPNAPSQTDLVKRYLLHVQKRDRAGRASQPNEAKTFRDFLGVSSKNEEGRPMVVQRLEAFRRVLCTKWVADSVNALRDVMWISAPTPETWLRYQRNFSKTCAVTSMIGYIVGLGDRHCGNTLIEEGTGRVVHIDLGLCFEFAQQREFVPFRLTRMIVAALGPRGENGVFRRHCEETLMKVRQNRESILALLQIFQSRPLRDAAHLMRLQRTQTEQEKNSRKFSEIYDRMKKKVQGTEFDQWIKVEEQVSRLIQAATDKYNLCRMYTGWIPWY